MPAMATPEGSGRPCEPPWRIGFSSAIGPCGARLRSPLGSLASGSPPCRLLAAEAPSFRPDGLARRLGLARMRGLVSERLALTRRPVGIAPAAAAVIGGVGDLGPVALRVRLSGMIRGNRELHPDHPLDRPQLGGFGGVAKGDRAAVG